MSSYLNHKNFQNLSPIKEFLSFYLFYKMSIIFEVVHVNT